MSKDYFVSECARDIDGNVTGWTIADRDGIQRDIKASPFHLMELVTFVKEPMGDFMTIYPIIVVNAGG